MSRGEHNKTAESIADEVKLEGQATAYELVAHDVWELATYEELAAGLQQIRLHAANLDPESVLDAVGRVEDVLVRLRKRDLSENQRHRTLLSLHKGEVPQ